MRPIPLAAAVAAVALASPAVGQSADASFKPGVPSWAGPPGPSAPAPSGSMAGFDPSLPDAPSRPVPVDGGLGLLAAAGAAYAARRFRRRPGDR